MLRIANRILAMVGRFVAYSLDFFLPCGDIPGWVLDTLDSLRDMESGKFVSGK